MFNFKFNLNFNENDVFIYLVDDDEFITKILKTKFETSTNYKVFSYTSGEGFLEAVMKYKTPKNSYTIVLLDYNLRTHKNFDAKNGLEILKIIRDVYPDFDVIMLSSIEDVDIATTSMHYGAISFVKKNENSFLRIHNIIKYAISKKKLEWTKRQSHITKRFFLTLITILIVLLLVFLKELLL